jgi:hypothetical protein
MRLTISLVAAIALCAGSLAAAAPAKSTFQLKHTTWTYTDKDGAKVQESIDADGNYIANEVGGKHLDHGSAVMKGAKACFTSAMTKEGQTCWTTHSVKVGQSMKTVSSKGEKLTVTRVDYAPMEMSK